jgi:hypothetical protein
MTGGGMNTIIEIVSSAWPEVEQFWRDNEHLKSDVIPMPIEDSAFRFAPNVFDYAKDKVIAAQIDDRIVGCVRIEAKHYGHLRIAALGKMAVDQQMRKNRIAYHLLQASCLYMNQGIFDISILWASILKLYEQFGYVAIYKNMMVKYLTSCDVPVNDLRQIPEKIGAW